MQTRGIVAALLVVIAFAAVAFAQETAAQPEKKDIVATLKEAGRFTTLLSALEKAGLVETLKGEGPFTLFAPDDAAFAKVRPERLAIILEDQEALKALLTRHVVQGKVMAAEVVKMEKITMLSGQALPIKVEEGKVTIGDAIITSTDTEAANGVVHVIDTVLRGGEFPVAETPAVEAAVAETPAVETPTVETPAVEAPAAEGEAQQ